MIVDLDDFHETNHRLDLLHHLKSVNPLFKVTLFTIPGLVTVDFLESLPNWMELAVHGWMHGGPSCNDPYECVEWDTHRMRDLLNEPILKYRFVRGFKAPGWQISQGCYDVLTEYGWWVADQHDHDRHRPDRMLTYFYEDSDEHWHGHIQNVCGNGLEETFDELERRVGEAHHFFFVSEAVKPWRSLSLAS